jgi:phosphoserine aminotransferase
MTRVHNFSAGPSALPLPVLRELQENLVEYPGVGASLLEVSHRSAPYDEVDQRAKATLKRLLGVGDGWEVMFLQGGASLQFHQVPLNFGRPEAPGGYLVTGHWAKLALKEAALLGVGRSLASTEADRFRGLTPAEVDADGCAWVHMTSNNTIYGTQWPREPECRVPLVCDASSDFLSRPIDMARYGLLYAGAQKNLGPAGVTVVLVERGFLATRRAGLPTMLDYGTHAGTLFHTPPTFAVWAVDRVLHWLEAEGGLGAMAARNSEKAARLYGALDASAFWTTPARVEARSQMNVCFGIHDPSLEKRLVHEAEAAGLMGLAGHRAVGGMRASLYNAVSLESVEALVAFLGAFEARWG